MKALKFLLSAVLFTVSTCAFAQFTNASSSKSSSSFGSASVGEDKYKRFEVGFTTGTLKVDGEEADESEKGLTAALIYGTRLMPELPLFLEYGAKATWLHSSEEEDIMGYEIEETFNYLNVSVPLNAVLKIGITDDVVVSPYVGLNLKVNIMAKSKVKYEEDTETLNYFDKDDMDDDVFNRFQLGMNLGVGVNFKKFYIGYNFQPDFMELAEKTKYPTNTISLGVNF